MNERKLGNNIRHNFPMHASFRITLFPRNIPAAFPCRALALVAIPPPRQRGYFHRERTPLFFFFSFSISFLPTIQIPHPYFSVRYFPVFLKFSATFGRVLLLLLFEFVFLPHLFPSPHLSLFQMIFSRPANIQRCSRQGVST